MHRERTECTASLRCNDSMFLQHTNQSIGLLRKILSILVHPSPPINSNDPFLSFFLGVWSQFLTNQFLTNSISNLKRGGAGRKILQKFRISLSSYLEVGNNFSGPLTIQLECHLVVYDTKQLLELKLQNLHIDFSSKRNQKRIRGSNGYIEIVSLRLKKFSSL